jgi:hypothetical protein
MPPTDDSPYAVTLAAAIDDSSNRIRQSDQGRLAWQARIDKTYELIEETRRLLANPLPVGALPLLPD